MASLTEVRDVAAEVQARWPNHRPWPQESLAALHLDLRDVDASFLFQALFQAIEAGREHPPSPAELAAAARRVAGRQPRQLPGPSSCDHRWGHLADGTLGTERNHRRAVVICVLCHLEQDARTGHLVDDPSMEGPRQDQGSWLAARYPGEDVSWEEHIRRTHIDDHPSGCGSPLCDLCEVNGG